jgi:predicted enzyme related to lactoylglutathione lyase
MIATLPEGKPRRLDAGSQEGRSMIRQVKFVGIAVRDQDAALAFWTEKVGFRVATDQPMGPGAGQRWIELAIPGAETRVTLFTPPGHEDRVGSFFNGSFACDDVEHTWRQMSARGVEFTRPPTREPWGTSAIFKDPEGNTFVLSSS